MRGPINYANPLSPHPLNHGRVGWWLALPNWQGGGLWPDLRGQRQGLLANGAAWSPLSQQSGFGSVALDGTDDYVTCGLPPTTINSGDWTLACRVRTTTLPQFGTLLCAGKDTGIGGNGIMLGVGSGAGSSGSTFQGLFAGIARQASGFTLTAGEWAHVVWTRKAGSAQSYVNGVAVGSASTASFNSLDGTSDIAIGYTAGGAGRYFAGQVNDVGVWQRGVTPTEAMQLCQVSLQGYPDVLNRVVQRRRVLYSIPAPTAFGHAYYRQFILSRGAA